MDLSKIWIEQCDAARDIDARDIADEHGTQQAPEYLVGEKFLNFLEAADDEPSFRAEIPAFVSEIESIFERWKVAAYLEIAKQSEPFDPILFDEDDETDAEDVEDMRKNDIRQCTRDLLLTERAREWLLQDGPAFGVGLAGWSSNMQELCHS